MFKNMMDKIKGRQEIVIEKKGMFGRTKIEITVTDRKGNVIETRIEKKSKESSRNRDRVEKRQIMDMEAKLEARKRERELAKIQSEESKKSIHKAVAVGAVVGVGATAFSVSRYKKVCEIDNNETKETLDLEGIQDILN